MRELIGGIAGQDIEKFIDELSLNLVDVAETIKSTKLNIEHARRSLADQEKELAGVIEYQTKRCINYLARQEWIQDREIPKKRIIELNKTVNQLSGELSVQERLESKIKEDISFAHWSLLAIKEPNAVKLFDQLCLLNDSYNLSINSIEVSPTYKATTRTSLQIPESLSFQTSIYTSADTHHHIIHPIVSLITMKLAIVFDNIDLVKHLWEKLMTQGVIKDPVKAIIDDQLLFMAAEFGSVDVLDFLIKQGASPFLRRDFPLCGPIKENFTTCNLLAIAIQGANNHVTDRQSTKETLRQLITQHQVDTDFVVTICRTEERGYYTQRTQVPIEKRYSLKQFDKTGVYTEVIEEIKHQKIQRKSPHAKKEPANAGASAASAAIQDDVPSLLTRIARLEAEVRDLRKENRQLKAKANPSYSATQKCRFFNGAPGSCRNGQECRFDHLISIQKR